MEKQKIIRLRMAEPRDPHALRLPTSFKSTACFWIPGVPIHSSLTFKIPAQPQPHLFNSDLRKMKIQKCHKSSACVVSEKFNKLQVEPRNGFGIDFRVKLTLKLQHLVEGVDIRRVACAREKPFESDETSICISILVVIITYDWTALSLSSRSCPSKTDSL